MKAFSPAQIKADILFLTSIVAVFGFNLTNTQTVVLLGASGLIAAVVNFAEAHVHVGVKLSATVAAAVKEIRSLLPAINEMAAALPGQVGAEVQKVLATIEKGPQPASTETATKAASKSSK